MPLTHLIVLNAKPKDKRYRVFDRHGLYLEVAPGGGKWWRVKYYFARREKRLSLGTFPLVSLKTARLRCIELRIQVAAGSDPAVQRKLAKQRAVQKEETFEAIAREWYSAFSNTWTPTHGDRILRRLENYVFPWVGRVPIRELTAVDILQCLRRLEQQNTHDTARRLLRYCNKTVRYAMMTGRAETDVLVHLRGVLAPRRPKHLASIKSPKEVGALLRAIDGYDGRLVTKFALRLAPLVFVRPGELRKAEWSEFDFVQREWRIPAERMKGRSPHIVPLASQALALLRELQPLTGMHQFVFPGDCSPSRPMSNNTLNAALRRLGYGRDDMTPHGFRSMASTLLNELGWSGDAIERQLAHGEKDAIRAVYNYAQYLPERCAMMQAWADYLDHLRTADYSYGSDRYGITRAAEGLPPLTQVNWFGPRRVPLVHANRITSQV